MCRQRICGAVARADPIVHVRRFEHFAREALQAGALGYVLKEAADTELVDAIRAAAEGRTYLNPALGARMASNTYFFSQKSTFGSCFVTSK